MNDTRDLKARIEQLVRDEIAPALQLDRDAVAVVDVSEGIVQLRLGSFCAGCPSTIMSIIMGLETELRQRLPEVAYVELIT